MNTSKILAFMSDHKPTQAMLSDIHYHGYEVIHVPSPQPERWASAQQAYTTMMRKCGREPDAIVLIMPPGAMGGMFLTMAKDIPIYQPKMQTINKEMRWTGRWEKIIGTSFRKAHVENI